MTLTNRRVPAALGRFGAPRPARVVLRWTEHFEAASGPLLSQGLQQSVIDSDHVVVSDHWVHVDDPEGPEGHFFSWPREHVVNVEWKR